MMETAKKALTSACSRDMKPSVRLYQNSIFCITLANLGNVRMQYLQYDIRNITGKLYKVIFKVYYYD